MSKELIIDGVLSYEKEPGVWLQYSPLALTIAFKSLEKSYNEALIREERLQVKISSINRILGNRLLVD